MKNKPEILTVRKFSARDWRRAVANAERRVEAARDSLAFVRSAIGDSPEQDARQIAAWELRVRDAEDALGAIREAAAS